MFAPANHQQVSKPASNTQQMQASFFPEGQALHEETGSKAPSPFFKEAVLDTLPVSKPDDHQEKQAEAFAQKFIKMDDNALSTHDLLKIHAS